ncbi:hypothetical protein [Acinetobacter sp. P1(2025)]|uniref:hypothetical protein n=1 Tax=Acinetobacter sp. P1(2025) TaxID=3446120 RepID=UPI003F52B78A
MAYRNYSIKNEEEYGFSSKAKAEIPTHSQIASSLDALAKLTGRTDGFPLNIVRQVREAIRANQKHPLRMWVEEPERYKREVLRIFPKNGLIS